MSRLLKRFWTFEPETLTLRYTRSAKHTVKQARLVTLVTENAEDIALGLAHDVVMVCFIASAPSRSPSPSQSSPLMQEREP